MASTVRIDLRCETIAVTLEYYDVPCVVTRIDRAVLTLKIESLTALSSDAIGEHAARAATLRNCAGNTLADGVDPRQKADIVNKAPESDSARFSIFGYGLFENRFLSRIAFSLR